MRRFVSVAASTRLALKTNRSLRHSLAKKPDEKEEPSQRVGPVHANDFRQLRLDPRLFEAVKALGWEKPTEIQSRVYTPAIEGNNIVASAVSGTGKTGAYLLPVLQRLLLDESQMDSNNVEMIQKNIPLYTCMPRVLILVPSNELVEQVSFTLQHFLKFVPVGSMISLSGLLTPLKQSELLAQQCDAVFLVSTPGRLLFHLDRTRLAVEEREKSISLAEQLQASDSKTGFVNLGRVRYFIVDECDQMLSSMSTQVQSIQAMLPREKGPRNERLLRTFLLSATLIPAVHDLVFRFAPKHTLIDTNAGLKLPEKLRVIVHSVSHQRKASLLLYFLRRRGKVIDLKNQQSILFFRTTARADSFGQKLEQESKMKIGIVHGEKDVHQRMKTLKAFAQGEIKILCATDVLARGIDLPHIGLVVHVDVPHSPEVFLHRSGRTFRYGNTPGKVLVLVDKQPQVLVQNKEPLIHDEGAYLAAIETWIGRSLPITKVPGPWQDVEGLHKVKYGLNTEVSVQEKESSIEATMKPHRRLVNRFLLEKSKSLPLKRGSIVDASSLLPRHEERFIRQRRGFEIVLNSQKRLTRLKNQQLAQKLSPKWSMGAAPKSNEEIREQKHLFLKMKEARKKESKARQEIHVKMMQRRHYSSVMERNPFFQVAVVDETRKLDQVLTFISGQSLRRIIVFTNSVIQSMALSSVLEERNIPTTLFEKIDQEESRLLLDSWQSNNSVLITCQSVESVTCDVVIQLNFMSTKQRLLHSCNEFLTIINDAEIVAFSKMIKNFPFNLHFLSVPIEFRPKFDASTDEYLFLELAKNLNMNPTRSVVKEKSTSKYFQKQVKVKPRRLKRRELMKNYSTKEIFDSTSSELPKAPLPEKLSLSDWSSHIVSNICKVAVNDINNDTLQQELNKLWTKS